MGRSRAFEGPVLSVVASLDGNRMLVVTEYRIHVVDARDGSLVCESPREIWASSVAFSPDGSMVLAIRQGKPCVFSAATFAELFALDVGVDACSVAWNERAMCVLFLPNRLLTWKRHDEPATTNLLLPDGGVTLSLSASHAMVVLRSTRLCMVPLGGGDIETTPLPDMPSFLHQTPHGILFLTNTGTGFVLREGRLANTVNLRVPITACCFDGHERVYASTCAGIVCLHILGTGAIGVSSVQGEPGTTIAYLRSARTLAFANRDWCDVTVVMPAFANAFPCQHVDHAIPFFPGTVCMLSMQTHRYDVYLHREDRSSILSCVNCGDGTVAYSFTIAGTVRAVLQTPFPTSAVVVSTNRFGTHVMDTEDDRTIVRVPQCFDGGAVIVGDTVYMVGRAGAMRIDNVGALHSAVTSLSRTSCYRVRVKNARVIATTAYGVDEALC